MRWCLRLRRTETHLVSDCPPDQPEQQASITQIASSNFNKDFINIINFLTPDKVKLFRKVS